MCLSGNPCILTLVFVLGQEDEILKLFTGSDGNTFQKGWVFFIHSLLTSPMFELISTENETAPADLRNGGLDLHFILSEQPPVLGWRSTKFAELMDLKAELVLGDKKLGQLLQATVG